jgi:DNA-3-methyladenine glycosylase I
MTVPTERTRCAWVPAGDALYVGYHDLEWGVPLHDERRLFELLCLEGAQAGLSWRTILARREGYRAVFAGFDPETVASFTDADMESALLDSRIVRNRLKVYGVRNGARATLELRAEGGLAGLLWDVVGGRPIQNDRRTLADIPVATPEAETMSRILKARGFRFVGPTICYAFMQAAGLVNDHTTDCFRYGDLVARASAAHPAEPDANGRS